MNNYLLSIIENVRKGINVEGTNVDIKRQWWDLTQSSDEFLKDIASMANTHTGDSIIIIGIDGNGILYDAPLPFDEASLQSKHKDKIDPKITIKISEEIIEGKTISIIEVPHSPNRPHVIKKYKNQDNWIPIRFGSSTTTASRADLDIMLTERTKSSAPNLKVSFHEDAIRWDNFAGYKGMSFAVRLDLDNFEGQSSEFITKVTIVENSGDHWTSNHFLFELGRMNIDEGLEVPANKILPNVLLYLSDQMPEGLRNRRSMPDFDHDTLSIIFECRSGKLIKLPIKAGWIH